MRTNRCYKPAQGQASAEFLIIFPLLVLLVFGIIQLGLIYQARATLNHATMLAARAGALHNGNSASMRSALATGLSPLYATEANLAGYALAVGKARLETSVASNMTTVNILNPTSKVLRDFGRGRLDGGAGKELPDDTLNYRNPAPGTSSGISVQDGNILHLRISYCYRLVVPVMDRFIYAAVNALTPLDPSLAANGMSDPFATQSTHGPHPSAITAPCNNPRFRGPRIVLRSEALVRMQSPFFESNL